MSPLTVASPIMSVLAECDWNSMLDLDRPHVETCEKSRLRTLIVVFELESAGESGDCRGSLEQLFCFEACESQDLHWELST